MSLKRVNEDKWVVITGGAGFIGSAMVRYLNDIGLFNLVLIDNLGKGEKWKNLVGKRFSEVVPIGETFTWLHDKHEDIQAFIHLGACSDTTERDADYLLENNYRFSVRLAEYALKYDHRFIYASSAATYGDGSQGFSDDHASIEALEPLNMYGYSKQLFDLWALRQGYLNQIVGLKFFNVFGPNEWHKGRMASAIVRMVAQVQSEGRICLFKSAHPDYADGEQKRDFLYVKDAARMVHSFLRSDIGGIFNIGSGIASSWNELARAVFHALGLPVQIDYIDMPSDLLGKYQYYTRAEMAKHARYRELNSRTMPLDAAVADYVNNHLIPNKTW